MVKPYINMSYYVVKNVSLLWFFFTKKKSVTKISNMPTHHVKNNFQKIFSTFSKTNSFKPQKSITIGHRKQSTVYLSLFEDPRSYLRGHLARKKEMVIGLLPYFTKRTARRRKIYTTYLKVCQLVYPTIMSNKNIDFNRH